MESSNFKKIQNEMIMFETQSNKFIQKKNYYAIWLNVINFKCDDFDYLCDISKNLLIKNSNHQPLLTYAHNNSICLLYSCVNEESSHYKNGNQYKIISEYVSFLVKKTKRNVTCKIVEYETKTEILTYFTWKVYKNFLKKILLLSEGKIDKADLKNKTNFELKNKLSDLNVNLDEVKTEKKFGIFFKLKKISDEVIIYEMSELFDTRDIQKYNSYFFG